MLASSFFFLHDDAYFKHQQILTGGVSGLGLLLAIVLLVNAFCLHRACIYHLLACIQVLVMMVIVWFAAYACFVFILFLIDCQNLTDVGYDCTTTAYSTVATSGTVFLLSIGFHSFFLYVLSKASRCQKQDDGHAIP
ncbi:hypothetical protein AAVH_03370 [Aphelenchoides avenae]|nr:hypothetical protein AAVH_03370 [Aphelenchus avenae]